MDCLESSLDAVAALPFRWLVDGCFTERQLTTRWHEQRRAYPPTVSMLIDRAWQEAQQAAHAAGQELFAGPLCRLLAWHADGDALVLDLGPTDYREFVGTNLRRPELAREYGREALANPLGVSIAVVTRDQYLVLQCRSDRVFENPGMLHVCGGNLDPHDAGNGGPFATARREVAEELGVPPAALTGAWCLGLVEARDSLKPEAVMMVMCDVAAADVRAGNEEVAALQLIALRPEALEQIVVDRKDQLTAQGFACLLAVGQQQFGPAWADAVARQLTGSASL
jgi:8-oxo-dGTP pyrophosphatase MutT (NUDIX family)